MQEIPTHPDVSCSEHAGVTTVSYRNGLRYKIEHGEIVSVQMYDSCFVKVGHQIFAGHFAPVPGSTRGIVREIKFADPDLAYDASDVLVASFDRNGKHSLKMGQFYFPNIPGPLLHSSLCTTSN